MSIIRKLKSLLGRDDGQAETDRDVTVTVEHDPENEAAVKGAEVTDSSEGEAETEGSADDAPAGEAVEETDAGDEAETVDDDEAVDDADAAETAEDSADADAADAAEADDAPDEVEIEDAEAETEADAETDAESDDGTDVETDADAEADDAGATGEPVDVLTGIGPAYAERLGDAGVHTVADLADADATDLAAATDVAEGRVQGWIDQAAEY